MAAKQLQFPKIPGVALPVEPNPKERFDYGPDFDKGIIAPGLPGENGTPGIISGEEG